MSESLRQNNLFQAQNWQVIYQAFNRINFNSYDYDTIRQALIDYIQLNYPEDFNDWIESSEFVSIIELLAYLAGSLAFRIDLNTRENFIDTATRRESVLRLARLISYNPRRCLPSRGLLKLTQVLTDEAIFDSNGINLANVPVNWNDANNPDWYEQWILVLNASFSKTNPFGQPVKSGKVGVISTDRYDFDNVATPALTYPFSATVNGQSMSFEIANGDFQTSTGGSINISSSGYFTEKSPNVLNAFSLIYRNDGNGNASPDTGFFLYFKQGTLSYTDFVLDTAIANRIIDVPATNVNELDVWVDTINDNGLRVYSWTKVPAVAGSNIVYNDLNRQTRNIFQVITRDVNGNDSISIKFGDGVFGNIPTGRIRVYYRTSNNQTYSILPQDITGVGLSLNYVSSINSINRISLTAGLVSTVANSLSRESSDFIKQRAPAVFYTQNRMVNGEDYNVFPLISSQALKVKSVNRVYSGQSRYIDINDPTGRYQNTKVFSDDGILFQQSSNSYFEVPNSAGLNSTQIIDTILVPLIAGTQNPQSTNNQLRDFYLANYPKITGGNVRWTNSNPNNSVFPQAHFYIGGVDAINNVVVLPSTQTGLRAGSYLTFSSGQKSYVVNEGNTQQTQNNVVIAGTVSNGSLVSEVMPGYRPVLLASEKQNIKSLLDSKLSFGITFLQSSGSWATIDPNNMLFDGDFSLVNQGNTTNQNLDNSWLIQLKYVQGSGWYITGRGVSYVFESADDVRFYFVNTTKVITTGTGQAQTDSIKILKVNQDPLRPQTLTQDYVWPIKAQEVYPDGYLEPRRVIVGFQDSNSDGIVDDPSEFSSIVAPNQVTEIDPVTGEITLSTFPRVYYKKTTINGFDYLNPAQISRAFADIVRLSRYQATLQQTWNNGDIIYVRDQTLFLEYNEATRNLIDVSSEYQSFVGRAALNYMWQHWINSNDRVDPAVMNVIDVFVLTSNYDTSIRNWIAKGKPNDPLPDPPTPEQLRMDFQEFDAYKMMTDQLIWHPVKYKLLFGSSAEPTLRATFKVVKNSGVAITDSEVKSRVIQSVDTYFNINNWDFGQSFFFTELAAYIHQQNPSILNSVVIVPQNANTAFGDLFEIKCDPDEIFISSARVTDVQIVPSLNQTELRTV
jgi:hypothetical protein